MEHFRFSWAKTHQSSYGRKPAFRFQSIHGSHRGTFPLPSSFLAVWLGERTSPARGFADDKEDACVPNALADCCESNGDGH
jgi:hypothetical protein